MSNYQASDIALASANPLCVKCHGYGRRPVRTQAICECVYRAAFRACLERYQREQETIGHHGAVAHWEFTSGGKLVAGILSAEYSADFLVAARRVLTPQQLAILELFFLQERAWFDCLSHVGLNRGDFFHAVYTTEERMGRALIERGLYPAASYFGVRRLEALAYPQRGPGWRGRLHYTRTFGAKAA